MLYHKKPYALIECMPYYLMLFLVVRLDLCCRYVYYCLLSFTFSNIARNMFHSFGQDLIAHINSLA